MTAGADVDTGENLPKRIESAPSVSPPLIVEQPFTDYMFLTLVAYMYLGVAVRTCLSAGFNRETHDSKSEAISRTWWLVHLPTKSRTVN